MPSYPLIHVSMVAYTNYPSDARVRREAETLAAETGFHVTFFALRERTRPDTYTMNGVTVRELDIEKYQGKSKRAYIISYLKFMAVAFHQLNRRIASGRLDIVHIHNMPNFMVFAAALPRLSGKKVILDIHDSIPETYLSKFTGNGKSRPLFKLLCLEEALCSGFADKIVCVNHIQKDKLVSRGLPPEKITTSLNVPDPRIFTRPHSEKAPKGKTGFKLVYHGTISRRLGIDIAIRAVAILDNEIPGVEFFVMGKGDDLDEFVDLSEFLGVSEKVHFNRQFLPIEELSGQLCNMDLGVIANRKDEATELMLPVKMLEYMALGIPVVAPRLKTIRHYFDENMIQYYEPESADSLASAIKRLYLEKDRRTGQVQTAEKFFEIYGWEKHKDGLIEMYRELTERR